MSHNILLFDSGVGGLSVFDSIHTRIPDANYTYLFDNACYPYGELTATELTERCLQLIPQVVSQRDIELVVIACNSASTRVLDALREVLSIPVVGVVPAIKPAAALCQSGVIGLLATAGTVNSTYTRQLAEQFARGQQVLCCPAPNLVEQAERKLQGLKVERDKLASDISPLLFHRPAPDCVVLGCTHFPLLSKELTTLLPGVRLIDSGDAIARRVIALLKPAHKERGACTVASDYLALYTKSEAKVDRLRLSFEKRGFSGYRLLSSAADRE
ncbi:glutamate racemase [Dongshaea marina]|uniref:glutamate racemase n=1 Tax=Dongshaea marina TaxID=2047966 RepID=UPI00131F3D0A|nr:glutamate racemase [Dongshaea marina]